MDNASKALIIAGAILISVMLVSLGVMLYNTAAGTAESSLGSISALGVTSYNQQFEASFGGNKNKQQASSLLGKIIANNGNDDNPDIDVYFNGTKQTDTNDAKAKLDKVPNKSRFIITGNYGGAQGVLDYINFSGDSLK